MSRRRSAEDPEFGSDSFLDIIANIVGILIILIVIAGVKVARQPAATADAPPSAAAVPVATAMESLEQPVQPADDIAPPSDDLPGPDELALLQTKYDREQSELARIQQQLSRVERQTSEVVEQATQIKHESQSLSAAIASYRQEVSATETSQSLAVENTALVQAQIQALQQQSTAEADRQRLIAATTERVYERQQTANDALQEIAEATRELQEVLEKRREEEVADQERLEHRLSPVARAENEQEIHFRLSSGHISWVPLEPLLESLKRQVTGRSNLIRRFGRYDGVCGPISGYLMKYTVERQSPTVMDNLNGVSMGYRISVSRWTISPTDSLRAESVDEALRFGSRFRQLTEAADPDATMTIWLYADDFADFRRLREFGHGLGLRVAARPLPGDSEITGSPSGSRSSAQ